MILDYVDQLVKERFGPTLVALGFKLRRQRDFVRSVGDCRQELGVLFNKARGEEAGSLQVYPGILFEDVETIAAEIQGVPRRKGWLTVSTNIGHLAKPGRFLEWPVSIESDLVGLGRLISQTIEDLAVPFWDQFSTLQGLIFGYESGDPRVSAPGQEHMWKFAAAYCLVGEPDRACEVLVGWTKRRPSEQVIDAAMKRVREIAERRGRL